MSQVEFDFQGDFKSKSKFNCMCVKKWFWKNLSKSFITNISEYHSICSRF